MLAPLLDNLAIFNPEYADLRSLSNTIGVTPFESTRTVPVFPDRTDSNLILDRKDIDDADLQIWQPTFDYTGGQFILAPGNRILMTR